MTKVNPCTEARAQQRWPLQVWATELNKVLREFITQRSVLFKASLRGPSLKLQQPCNSIVTRVQQQDDERRGGSRKKSLGIGNQWEEHSECDHFNNLKQELDCNKQRPWLVCRFGLPYRLFIHWHWFPRCRKIMQEPPRATSSSPRTSEAELLSSSAVDGDLFLF